MTPELKKQINQLQTIENQRNTWIKLGVIFVIYLVLLAVEWYAEAILTAGVWILAGIIIALTTIVWWVWTMFLIKSLLNTKLEEIQLLTAVIEDIKTVKNDVAELKKKL